MASIEKRQFLHNHIEYILEWATNRHYSEPIFSIFGKKLLNYYEFVCSMDYPEYIFNSNEFIRCSQFRIKGLEKDAQKAIALKLLSNSNVFHFTSKTKSPYISENILKLPKMAEIWFDIFSTTLGKNPGHGPVLEKILQINENALTIELPVWTTSDEAIVKRTLPITPYLCRGNEIITGHIDLLLYDETDNSLVVADYKPENHFLRSIAQVATYGLILKRILGYDRIKCLSFSREKAWLYKPEIIQDIIPQFLVEYGNPNLKWLTIIPTL